MNELRFNLRDIDKVVLYGGRTAKKAAAVFEELKPDFLLNAGMFSMTGEHRGLTVCDTIIDGQIINGGNYTDKGIAWDDNDLCPEQTASAKRRGYEYFLGGSPSLVWYGNVLVDGKGFSNWFLNTAESIRIGMGINDDELIFCFPEKEMKLPDFAKMMRDAGCKHAINLDGGGSTSVFQNQDGKMVALNKRTEDRACSTWLAVYLKETAKEVDKVSKKVCLDAGHGGADPGAVGPHDIKEKDVVLDITRKTGAILEFHGVDVIYTRAEDKKVELAERTKISNAAKADLFVSIHANAASAMSANGQETFCYKTGTRAATLAQNIQNEIVAASGLKNRGVKTANYYVLVNSTMPAALVETAFISNPEEEKLLKDSAWQQKIAVAIAKGVLTTLGIAFKEEPAKTEPVKSEAVDSNNFPESWNWIGPEGLAVMDGKNPTKALTREQFAEVLFRLHKKGLL